MRRSNSTLAESVGTVTRAPGSAASRCGMRHRVATWVGLEGRTDGRKATWGGMQALHDRESLVVAEPRCGAGPAEPLGDQCGVERRSRRRDADEVLADGEPAKGLGPERAGVLDGDG